MNTEDLTGFKELKPGFIEINMNHVLLQVCFCPFITSYQEERQ